MIRKVLLLFSLILALVCSASAQTNQSEIVFGYNYDLADSVQAGLNSIRGVGFTDDLFGDGKSAIAATNYFYGGTVQLFSTVGDDSIELIWSSPFVDSLGGGSTPRYVMFGDLDNDGLKEVIYHSNSNGILIYEWDGVPGSNNFGTSPSFVIKEPTLSSSYIGRVEYMETMDIDQDGVNELILPYNSSPSSDDRYYVISIIGTYSTDNPGFAVANVEMEYSRTQPGNYGFGGSPYGMFAADLDGDGMKDILIHNWNYKNVVPVKTNGADSYTIADTTNDKAHLYLTFPNDDVALFGAVATDVDNDGRDEVYLPTYGTNEGILHMISFGAGESIAEIDSGNLTTIDMNPTFSSDMFGSGYGDIDQDGKPNIYISGTYGMNVVSAEFQGGDKTDPANWLIEPVYEGSPDIISSVDISVDSLGVADTVMHVNTAFVSKMWDHYTDFDKDGKEDMILPYQSLNDSITTTVTTWTDMFDTTITQVGTDTIINNPGDTTFIAIYDTSIDRHYDVTASTVENPKRWSLRILESLTPNSIDSKDMTIITPDQYVLKQNYPNPFNPTTNIQFVLPIRKKISIFVYNALGQKVKTLVDNKTLKAGAHEVTWDGTNEVGSKVATGMYIYTMKFGNFTKSKRMMLVK